jgi:hypothetical protein
VFDDAVLDHTGTVRRLCAVVVLVVGGVTAAASAQPGPGGNTIRLPRPVAATTTFPHIGLRPDRRLVSHAPGPVRTRELVTVALSGSGTPAAVVLDEHLHLRGTGDYLIYERGPARAVRPLDGSVPPVLELGTVLWQGFSPGGRNLAAELRLDPALETARLPLRVSLAWRGDDGTVRPLGAGGAVPGPGVVTIHLDNTTGIPESVQTGTAAAVGIGGPLDSLATVANASARHRTTAFVLPVAGVGLPTSVAGTGVTTTTRTVVAPLRVSGPITASGGGVLSGPTVTAIAGGGTIDGVLAGSADFQLRVRHAGHIRLGLSAVPSLDPRTLVPPAPARTWTAWAASHPGPAPRQVATDTLVGTAAATARAHELSPYVGSDIAGPATTAFRYVIASAAAAPGVHARLRPKPYAITVAAIAGLAILVNAGLLWRRL